MSGRSGKLGAQADVHPLARGAREGDGRGPGKEELSKEKEPKK